MSRISKRASQNISDFIKTVPAVVWECYVLPDAPFPLLKFISDNICHITGYSSDECLQDQNFYNKIVYQEDRNIVIEKIIEIINHRGEEVFESRWVSKDGSIAWIESHCSVLLDNDGTYSGLRAFSFDISKKKQAENVIKVKARQQEGITRLGRKALEGLPLPALMNEAVIVVQDVLGCEYVKILELLHDENLFILRAATGWQKELIGNAKAGAGTDSEAGYAILVDYPVIVNDMKTETRFKRQTLLFDCNAKSGMSIIIRGKDIPFGVLSVHTANLRTFSNEDAYFLGAIANIISLSIERKKSQGELENSLKEKEILLKEIHHRVKNNLQVISSLLNLQSRYITDKESLEIFIESQNRIRSMALIHEKLYQSKNLFKINFEDYASDLLKNLLDSYYYGNKKITSQILINDIHLSVDTAVALGLIINELASNSLKHAFKRDEQGEMVIDMTSNKNEYKLIFKDNGCGFPENIDFKETSSLGLQLVITLVEQLNGQIELINKGGAEFCISFTSHK